MISIAPWFQNRVVAALALLAAAAGAPADRGSSAGAAGAGRAAAEALAAGRPEEALELLGRAREGLAPESRGAGETALSILEARAHLELGDLESAAASAARALRHASGIGQRSEASALAAAAHLAMGDARAAVELLEPLRRASALSPDATLLLAQSLDADGRRDRALELLDELARAGSAQASHRLGVLLHDRGDHQRAVAAFAEAARTDPGDYYSRIYLARSLIELRRAGDAERVLGEAAAIARTPEVEYLLGRAAALRGGHAAACERFEAALAMSPRYSEALYGLALSLRATAKEDAARRAFGRFAELHRRDQERLRRATSLEQACAARPRDAGPALEAVRHHLSEDEPDRAEAYAWKALRRDPESLDARLALARALARQGRRSEAALHYGKLLRRSPDHAAARAELRSLIERHGAERR